MTTTELVLPIRHKAQAQVYAERARFNVLAMGRRFGKSVLFLDLLLDDPGYGALDGYPVAWFAGTSKIFDEVWRLMLETLPAQIIKRTDSQKHRIELVTGGIIDFWSLDNGDAGGAGRGRKYRRVAIDEAALVPRMLTVWSKAIRPTLADLTGDAWFASTPRGIQNDYYDLWQRGQPGTKAMKNWKSWQLPSHANPHLSRQELAELKAEYIGRPLDYRQEILAEFVADEGQVFKLEWLEEAKPPEKFTHLYGSWDLAVTEEDLQRGDYSVGVVIGQDALGRYWLLDLVRGRWNPAEVAERMLALAKKHELIKTWYEGGAIGRGTETWLRKLQRERSISPPYYFEIAPHSGRGDKVVRCTPLIGVMASSSLHVPIGAKWLDELRDEMASFPRGRHDDQVDALSQMFQQLRTIRQSSPIPKDNSGIDPSKITGAQIKEYHKHLADEEGRPIRKRVW